MKYISIQDIPEIKEKFANTELSSGETQINLIKDIYAYANKRCWQVLQIVCLPLHPNGVGITLVYLEM